MASVEQLHVLKKAQKLIVMISTTHKHRNLSWLTRSVLYVETPRGAFTYHPLPPLKVSLAAVNHGPARLTDAPYMYVSVVMHSVHNNNTTVSHVLAHSQRMD